MNKIVFAIFLLASQCSTMSAPSLSNEFAVTNTQTNLANSTFQNN